MDLHRLVYGLCLAGLILAAPLLGNPGSWLRRLLARQLARLGGWLLVQVRPEPHVDPAAEEWFRVLRGDQLRVDLRRLQLLLLTDMHMSATRQLGNRLARDSVLRDLQALGAVSPLSVAAGEARRQATHWDVTDRNTPVQPSYSTSTWGASSRGANVETLDISWRS